MLLTLVYLLLVAFVGLNMNLVVIGVTGLLDALALLVFAGYLGIGQDQSNGSPGPEDL